jgi:hypothetical protein
LLGKRYPRYPKRFPIVPKENPSVLDIYLDYCNVPRKGLPTDELYDSKVVEIPIVQVAPKQYIGVGYKDKGNLPREEYISPSDTLWIPETYDHVLFDHIHEILEYILYGS